MSTVFLLNPLHATDELVHGRVPVDRNQLAICISQQGSHSAVGGVEDSQRFPTFRAGHPQVDRVLGFWRQINCHAIF